jgi:hypothetical protein
VKKKIYVRSSDGMFHESWETERDDPWQPIPGQDMEVISPISGSGWYIVTSCRPVYSGSPAHNQIALELDGTASMIYLDHMEVYLEPKAGNAAQTAERRARRSGNRP